MSKTHSYTRPLGAIASLAACLLVAGCAGAAPSSEGDSGGMPAVTLRASIPNSESSSNAAGMKAFADYARKASGGKIEVELSYNATLIPIAELLPGLSSGLADIGLIVNSYAPDKLPAGAWVDQLAPSVEDWGFPQVTISPALQAGFAYGNEVLREELAANNVVPLHAAASGPYLMLCTDPVNGLQDLAGRTIRVGGEPWTTEVTNLGMTPSFIPGTETYEALQRGVIDCTYQEPSSLVTMGLTQIAKHLALTDGSMSSGAQFAINKDTWDSLVPEAQQILREATVPATAAFSRTHIGMYQQLIVDAEKEGVTFSPISDIDQAIQQNRQARGKSLIAKAPSTVKDPEALRNDFVKMAGRWDTLWDEHVGVKSVQKTSVKATVDGFSGAPDTINWDAYEKAVARQLELELR